MRKEILTTSKRGLQTDSFPYRLYQKAKVLGVWNPEDIDFSRDVLDWATLSEEQRHQTLRTLSAFQAGEEAVTLDLLPLIRVIAQEGRLEEEMFLTTFLFEEAKHTEFFRLHLDALGENRDLSHYHSASYRTVFYEILPEAMEGLIHNPTPEKVADASTVYNMFVEGVLAETGYFGFYNGLNKIGKMPGLMEGIGHIRRDESRHIGYGTFLLQRLICEHPHLFDRVEKKMAELAPLAFSLTREGMNGKSVNAYGVPLEEIHRFSQRQLKVRMEVLARAKTRKLEEIYRTSEAAVGLEP